MVLSMAFYLPPEWKDDQTIDVLFSPFRESREVNPHSWDRKMNFWSTAILEYCRNTGVVIIETAALPRAFERKGKMPVCLSKVLQELIRERKLQKVEEYMEDNSTWLRWGFNWGVKKPAGWTLNTFIKKPMSWTYNKIVGSEECQSEISTQLVVKEILMEKAEQLLSEHYRSMPNETTDAIIGYDQLYEKYKDLFHDQFNFHITLLKLVRDRKCAIFETENNCKVVKFAKTEKESVTPPNDSDMQLFKLQKAESVLQDQVVKLSLKSEQLRTEAKDYIRKAMKPSALNVLRKKKKVESLRSQKEASLDNLHQLIMAIEHANSNKLVLDAYSSGNELFKKLSKDFGLTPEAVDDVMTDMEETFNTQDDINQTLSQSPTSLSDPSLEELESELSMILTEGGADGGNDSNFGGDFPEVPQTDPIDSSATITDTVINPQQELVDAMCKMRILPEDDLVLPSVPSFNPGSASTSRTEQFLPSQDPV